MEDYKNIVALLMPDVTPAEVGYLWAKFGISGLEGVRVLFYCANMEIAAELLVNQIKPNLDKNNGFIVIFPNSDNAQITQDNPALTTSFTVVHYGQYPYAKAQAIARTHVVQVLEMFRESQQRYITGITLNSSTFDRWSDDNSTVQQYTANVTVSYVQPYQIAKPC